MSDNPLVVVAADGAGGALVGLGTPHERTDGLSAVDAGLDAADAFARGDWIEGSVSGLGAGLDVAGAVLDPIGTLGSCIAGWLLEHLGPVQHWLDQLCGDPADIAAASETWQRVSGHLVAVSGDYRAAVRADLAGQAGVAVAAYERCAGTHAAVAEALAGIAGGVGAGVLAAGTLLAGVRDFITALLADAVGQAVKLVAESVMTVGLAAPHAYATAAAKCRATVQEARLLVEDLSRSLDRMGQLLRRIDAALGDGASAMSGAAGRSEVLGERTRAHGTDLLLSLAGSATQADDLSPTVVGQGA